MKVKAFTSFCIVNPIVGLSGAWVGWVGLPNSPFLSHDTYETGELVGRRSQRRSAVINAAWLSSDGNLVLMSVKDAANPDFDTAGSQFIEDEFLRPSEASAIILYDRRHTRALDLMTDPGWGHWDGVDVCDLSQKGDRILLEGQRIGGDSPMADPNIFMATMRYSADQP